MNCTLARSTSREILIIAALLVGGTSGLQAQTHALDAGSFRVGGGGSISTVEVTRDGESVGRDSRAVFAPMVQYFVIPHLAIGGTLSVDHRWAEGGSITSLGLGPSAIYYLFSPDREFHPYVTAGANLSRARNRAGPNEVVINRTGFRFAGGMLFMMSPSVGINGELYYDQTRDRNRRDSPPGLPALNFTSRSYGFAAGLSVFLF